MARSPFCWSRLAAALLAAFLVLGASGAEPADLRAIRELVRGEKYAEAEAQLRALEPAHSEDAVLLLLWGEVLLALNRPADAVAPLERSATLAPAVPRTHFQLGTALAGAGQPAKALEAFGAEAALEPADPKLASMARLNRSLLFQQQGNAQAAIDELEVVARSEHASPEIYGDLATLYLERQRTDLAANALERGLAAGFTSAPHLASLGTRLYNDKAYEKARAFLERSIAIDPDRHETRLSLAATLDQLDQRAAADVHYRRFLELRPTGPDADRVRARLKRPK